MVPLATGQAGANLTDDKQAVDAQIDDAYDEVLSFNKKVAKATRQVLDAREQLPSAQANLAKAEAAASEASAAHQGGEAGTRGCCDTGTSDRGATGRPGSSNLISARRRR